MEPMSTPLYAAIEAGGTKFVLAVASAPSADAIVDRAVVPTDDPADTFAACLEFFQRYAASPGLRSMGIGSFGPIDLGPGRGYGTIVGTPKPGWSGASLTGAFAPLGIPILVDTDVNAAGLAEAHNMGVQRLVYYTIGTGIGGGLIVGGEPVTGRPHTEAGHISVETMVGDVFAGGCPWHGNCAEGMTAGPNLEARFGVGPGQLGDVLDEVVPTAAWYIAQLAANANFMIAPERVVLGGGIMGIPGMLDAVRLETARRINGYTLRTSDDPEWLVAPSLGTDSGIVGSLMLADRAAEL